MSIDDYCSDARAALCSPRGEYEKYVEEASYQQLGVLAAILLLAGADGTLIRERGELVWTYRSLITILFPLRCIEAEVNGVDLPHSVSCKSLQKGLHATVDGVMKLTPCEAVLRRVKALRDDPPVTLLTVLELVSQRFKMATLEAARTSAILSTKGARRFVADCALVDEVTRRQLRLLSSASDQVLSLGFRLGRMEDATRDRVLLLLRGEATCDSKDWTKVFMAQYRKSDVSQVELQALIRVTETEEGKSLISRLRRLKPEDRSVIAELI